MPDFARSADAGVQAQLDRLALTSPAGDRLGLARISGLLDRLGRPQDKLPPVLHVAGTNGKGSTIALLRTALEMSGYTVHAFTSPHLVRFNERIRIAGRLIDDGSLESLLKLTIDCGADLEPSFFEVTTAVAMTAFAQTPADACLLEVGLGGRLDATNVIDSSLVGGIASIGIDHQRFLGDTLAEIAAEKAGVARAGVPLVALAQDAEAEKAIARVANAKGAKLVLEGRDWKRDPALVPALPGPHQVANANLAWQMLKAQERLLVDRPTFIAAIGGARWEARLQRLGAGPLERGIETWIDGAHNADAARALASHLAQTGAAHIVLGILANKDYEAIVAPLSPHALSLSFVPVQGHEHHDPARLAKRFDGHAYPNLEAALEKLPAPRLVAGSLYLAGEALALNRESPS